MVQEILLWPSPVLQTVSVAVGSPTAADRAVAQDLIDTCVHAGGAGLSAIQVGIPKRIVCLRGRLHRPIILYDPVVSPYGIPRFVDEGCLSVPGVSESVLRYPEVAVASWGRYTQRFSGLEAQVLQHELEHLDGHIFLESLPAPAQEQALRRSRLYQERRHRP